MAWQRDATASPRARGSAANVSKTLMKKLERESAVKMIPKPLNDDQNVEMLSGDRDVFGDDSFTIISTPGHTPGRQSLLVKLPKTGVLILTGDLVRFQYM
jgi:glyoxylase-like metal-dependent hydrolase (beta-lactamase superfamily II)